MTGRWCAVEVRDGASEHGGLSGAGWSDDEHQSIVSCDRGRGLVLPVVESGFVDRRRARGQVELCGGREGEDVFLLCEDVAARRVRGDRLDPDRAIVGRPAWCRVARRVEVDAGVEDRVDGPLEDLEPGPTVDVGLWGSGVAEGAKDIQAVPGRHLLGESLDDRFDREGSRSCRLSVSGVGNVAGEDVAVHHVIEGLVFPLDPEVGECPIGLLVAGVCGCRSFDSGAFADRRVAPVAVDEVGEAVLHLGVDDLGALGERSKEVRRDAGDLGLAVDDLVEGDAVAMGEFGSKDGLVQAAERALVLLEHACVEGEPATVGGLDFGGDDDVGVQVWVVGAAG